jgi:small subunit ribosomal protein S6
MKLRHYETLYLLHPDLNDEEREARAVKLQNIITDDGGKIVKVDPWPLRKLAYRVMKQTQGWYVCMEYAAPGSAILELTRNMRLDESLMKFVTIKKADVFDPAILERAEEEAAAKAKAEEEAARAAAEAEAAKADTAVEETPSDNTETAAAGTEEGKE